MCAKPHKNRPDRCHVVLYHAITIPYHTIPYHTIPCHTMPYHAIPCYYPIQSLRSDPKPDLLLLDPRSDAYTVIHAVGQQQTHSTTERRKKRPTENDKDGADDGGPRPDAQDAADIVRLRGQDHVDQRQRQEGVSGYPMVLVLHTHAASASHPSPP